MDSRTNSMRLRRKQPRLKLTPEEYVVIRNQVLERDELALPKLRCRKGLAGSSHEAEEPTRR